MATAREVARLLARGGRLTRQEEEDVAAFLAINDITRAWVKDGTGIPRFPYFEANYAYLHFNPNEPLWIIRQNSQIIQNGISTPVEFDLLELNNGAHFWKINDPSRIYWHGQPKKNTLVVGGYVHFEGNNQGERIVHLNEYDQNSNLIAGGTLSRFPSSSTMPLSIPFLSIRRPVEKSTYICLEVEQNSGSSLNITFISLAMFRIY